MHDRCLGRRDVRTCTLTSAFSNIAMTACNTKRGCGGCAKVQASIKLCSTMADDGGGPPLSLPSPCGSVDSLYAETLWPGPPDVDPADLADADVNPPDLPDSEAESDSPPTTVEVPLPYTGSPGWSEPDTSDPLLNSSDHTDEDTIDPPEPSSPRPPRKSRRKTYYPGPTRENLLQELEMVPKKVKYLWSTKVPRHLDATIQDDLAEIFSPPRITEYGARHLNLRGNLAADLETGWDFTKPDDRVNIAIQIRARRPKFLMLSPLARSSPPS